MANNKIYELIILSGIILLILSSLLGWSSRSNIVLAAVEGIILCLFLLLSTGLFKAKIKIPFYLLLFLFFSSLSIISSVYKYNSIIGFVEILLFIIAFWLVSQSIKTIKHLKLLNFILITTALVAAIYGIINFFQLQDITIGVASFFGWRNIFAGYILLFLPLTLTLFLTTNSKLEKRFFGLTSILLVVNLYLSFSQGGWLSFLIIFIIIILFLRKIPKKKLFFRLGIFLITSVILIIALLKIHGIAKQTTTSLQLEEASTVQTYSLSNRFDYWKTSWEIFTHYPITGVGLGNFQTLYTHFQQNIWSWSISPHNFILLLLTEVGILGTISFLFFLYYIFRKGLTIIQKTKNSEDQIIFASALGITGNLVASFFHNLVDLDWEIPALLLIFFIQAGLLIAIKNITEVKIETTDQAKPPLKTYPLIGFLVFIILGYLIVIPLLTDLWNTRVDKLQEELPYPEEGFIILQKAIKFNPINADLYQNLSESYQLKILDHNGDRKENQSLSIKYARKALELDPLSAGRHQFLGYSLNLASSGKDQEIQEAEKELKTAILYNSKNSPYSYQILGFILSRQEKYYEAFNILTIPLTLFDEESKKKIFMDEARLKLIDNYLNNVKNLRDQVEKYLKK